MILSQIDVRRHLVEHSVLVGVPQWRVTFEAAGKHLESFEIEYAENLAGLFLVITALNQHTPSMDASGHKPRVACEDDPILGFRDFDDFVVIETIRIRHIEAENSQPT